MSGTTLLEVAAVEPGDLVLDVTVDGGAALLAGAEGALSVWSGAGSVRTLPSHVGGVLRVGASGTHWVSTGEDGVVQIVDRGDSGKIQRHKRGKWTESFIFSPETRCWYFAVGENVEVLSDRGDALRPWASGDGTLGSLQVVGDTLWASSYQSVFCWNLESGSLEDRFFWQGSILASAIQPVVQEFVVATSQDQTIHVWRTHDGEDFSMSGFGGKVKAFEFFSNGESLVVADGPTLMAWDFRGSGPGGRAPSIYGDHLGAIHHVRCQPGGRRVAAGTDVGEVMIWHGQQGGSLLASGGRAQDRVTALAWWSDNEILAAHASGVVVRYALPT